MAVADKLMGNSENLSIAYLLLRPPLMVSAQQVHILLQDLNHPVQNQFAILRAIEDHISRLDWPAFSGGQLHKALAFPQKGPHTGAFGGNEGVSQLLQAPLHIAGPVQWTNRWQASS